MRGRSLGDVVYGVQADNLCFPGAKCKIIGFGTKNAGQIYKTGDVSWEEVALRRVLLR